MLLRKFSSRQAAFAANYDMTGDWHFTVPYTVITPIPSLLITLHTQEYYWSAVQSGDTIDMVAIPPIHTTLMGNFMITNPAGSGVIIPDYPSAGTDRYQPNAWTSMVFSSTLTASQTLTLKMQLFRFYLTDADHATGGVYKILRGGPQSWDGIWVALAIRTGLTGVRMSVPVPSALLLLVSGLIGLYGFRKYKK